MCPVCAANAAANAAVWATAVLSGGGGVTAIVATLRTKIVPKVLPKKRAA